MNTILHIYLLLKIAHLYFLTYCKKLRAISFLTTTPIIGHCLFSFYKYYRPEMVVGWYHSHPGFGCWLSGVDINTQQVSTHILFFIVSLPFKNTCERTTFNFFISSASCIIECIWACVCVCVYVYVCVCLCMHACLWDSLP